MRMMLGHAFHGEGINGRAIGRWSTKPGLCLVIMTQVARLVRHRGAVPMYGYPIGLGVSPVSIVRAEHENVVDSGPHIHEFPALWYTEGRVYVAAAGVVLDPGRVAHSNTGVGLFFDPATL